MQIDRRGDALLIAGGSLVTGDGRSFFESASIRIRDGLIVEVSGGRQEPVEGERLVLGDGMLVLPGLINGHAHGTILGPSMPSGSLPLDPETVRWQRNRHLLSGTTSLINVCGLALEDERDGVLGAHAIDIRMSSALTPRNLAAADAIDGRGLGLRHRLARLEEIVGRGQCQVLGEAGGGQTLGGGAQDYRFIPEAIEAKTGLRIDSAMARRLKEAVLGRKLDGGSGADDEELAALLIAAGLEAYLTTDGLRQLMKAHVLAPVQDALAGLAEIAAASAAFCLPAIFHHALPTAAKLVELARRHPGARMIAAHANHPSFRVEEAIEAAIHLKSLGVTIDVSTLDMIETRFRNGPENFDSLIAAGLVDTISTDYAGGDWDPITCALHRIVSRKMMDLPAAVALATGNPASIFPELFGDRGVIAPQKRADIIICERHNLAKVRHVFVAGRQVVKDGQLFDEG
jgi:alpha-D-ribose 1-methylphosphonate 5-triphosphate diphosphatase PhnM